jgi:glycine oxidase
MKRNGMKRKPATPHGRRCLSCTGISWLILSRLPPTIRGMETPDILVIGGGIIGCSLARELARVSPKVNVVDRARAGSAASSAAAGLLSPALATAPAGPLLELCYESADLYASWVDELQQDGAGDVGFRRDGLLEVWPDADAAARHHVTAPDRRRPGRRVEVLAGDELRRREPALVGNLAGAAYYPDDAQVDPALLSRAVARVAELAGVTVRENEPVQRLVCERDRVTAVYTDTRRYVPGLVVLAAGAWSGGLLEPLGLSLPTRPVKGQMLLADCRVSPVRTPLHADETVFVPRPDGTLLLGVTVEEAGFDDRVTLDGLRSILDRACALVPVVGQLAPARSWAGLRPATPDELPYMGPLPPLRNLWVCAGHFRKGILLAPLCARLMARSIVADRPDERLGPFGVTRRVQR